MALPDLDSMHFMLFIIIVSAGFAQSSNPRIVQEFIIAPHLLFSVAFQESDGDVSGMT